METSPIRKIAFFSLLLTPAALLLAITIIIGTDLYEIHTIDPGDVYRGLQQHLAKELPESFPAPDNFFVRDGSRKTVFIFGESSLVLSDGGTFPEYLEKRSPALRVVNFGVSGIDSFLIRHRVEEALSLARPDIIILYYGHNDYNNAYQGYIVPNFYQQFDLLLRLAYRFHDRAKPLGVLLPDDAYWFSRLKRPRFIQLFESWGMLDIDSRPYEQVNRLILDHYERNTAAIIKRASALRVPVVLITPVGNLRAEPFGDIHTTTALYRQGMSSTEYLRSLRYLKMARDAEFLTYDLRAKTPLIEYLRHLKQPNVYVLDLEKRLEEMHFGFGYGEFLDYFHFNDRSHRLVADIIHAFLSERGLIGPRRPKMSALPAARR